MKILVHWLILTLAVLAVPYFIDGISVDSIIATVRLRGISSVVKRETAQTNS